VTLDPSSYPVKFFLAQTPERGRCGASEAAGIEGVKRNLFVFELVKSLLLI
jgi:hypothetical protein